MGHRRIGLWGCIFTLALPLAWGLHAHEAGKHSHPWGTTRHEQPSAPVRMTMEELHRHGGVPPGWRFGLPTGDPVAGCAVFTKLECYQCHVIQGESFPQASTQGGNSGPELTGMGSNHPSEYFADAILNPNGIIVIGPGYTDADGMSIMPDYRDTLTVAELIDLVAYLKDLKGEHAHASARSPEQHTGTDALLDKEVGDYHIRLIYHEAVAGGQEQGTQSHDRHGHGSHGGRTAKAPSRNHLMAFITDAKTGAPVPYLPVTATIAPVKRSPHQVKLVPMMGAQGFHYGADVRLPSQSAKVTLSIGATTMRVMPSAAGSFAKPQRVSFDWTPERPASTGAKGHAPLHQGQGKHSGLKGH